MTAWILAALFGGTAAALSYARAPARDGRLRLAAAACRTVALMLLVAILLDAQAPWRRGGLIVALDASGSWLRGGDSLPWQTAVGRVAALDADSLVLFGGTVRGGDRPAVPADAASRLAPLVASAAAGGRPVAIITDGELDEAESLANLPRGSTVEVVDRPAQVDAALLSIDVPRAAAPGDSLEIRVMMRGGSSGAPAGTVTVLLGDQMLAAGATPAVAPFGEAAVVLRVVVPRPAAARGILRAIVAVQGDREVRNDTIAAPLEVSDVPGAVLVSSSPDYDSRYVLHVLRGALALPARGYLRIAPGDWRAEGTLASVTESQVRAAAAGARLLVLHGDTSVLGSPRTLGRGALALLAPPGESGEWYAIASPVSPLSPMLQGIPWDSLPPIDVAPRLPPGEWRGMETQRSRRFERRIAITGGGEDRRWVVVGAAGLWRWYFRGGVAADAYTALWGSIFDWLVADRSDARRVLPSTPVVRAGEGVLWRRASSADSMVRVALRRVDGGGGDTITLRFPAGQATTESAPLGQGVYEATVPGGTALLAVNVTGELLPRRPTVASGPVGSARIRPPDADLRGAWWAYALVVASLCGEWVLRRRAGLQ